MPPLTLFDQLPLAKHPPIYISFSIGKVLVIPSSEQNADLLEELHRHPVLPVLSLLQSLLQNPVQQIFELANNPTSRRIPLRRFFGTKPSSRRVRHRGFFNRIAGTRNVELEFACCGLNVEEICMRNEGLSWPLEESIHSFRAPHARAKLDEVAVPVVGKGVVAQLAADLGQGREAHWIPPMDFNFLVEGLDAKLVDAIAEFSWEWETSAGGVLGWRRERARVGSRGSCLS